MQAFISAIKKYHDRNIVSLSPKTKTYYTIAGASVLAHSINLTPILDASTALRLQVRVGQHSFPIARVGA
jgi:hypothetical protein